MSLGKYFKVLTKYTFKNIIKYLYTLFHQGIFLNVCRLEAILNYNDMTLVR